MQRWDDFFAMLRSARKHVLQFGYGLRPYKDSQRQMVGVICEQMHEVWQIEVTLVNEQLELDPNVRDLIKTVEGLQDLSKILTFGSDSAHEKYSVAMLRLREERVF